MTATYPALATLKRAISNSFALNFGILLPLAAIVFEAATGICAGMIDPMPTWSYLILLLAVRRDALEHSRAFAAMAGFSAAIALFYTILLAPLLPFAIVGLLVLLPGLG